MKTIMNKLKNKKVLLAALVAFIVATLHTTAFAAAPSLSQFFKQEKTNAALGWASIVVGVVCVACIVFGVMKAAPVAMAFWRRRDGMDQGAEAGKSYAIGLLILIAAPMIILGIAQLNFGAEIWSAIQTAVSGVYK